MLDWDLQKSPLEERLAQVSAYTQTQCRPQLQGSWKTLTLTERS